MSQVLPIQNYQPQANPQVSSVTASGGVAKAEVSFVVVPDVTTKANELYWGQVLHFKSLPKLESPGVSEYLLTQFGIYHATSLIHILDEAVYYPKVKSHILSIIAPYVKAHQEVDFDILPTTSTGVIGSSSGDERGELTDSEVRNMPFFRFLDELEERTYKPDDTEDEE
jgi:hypothetical protein